MKGFFVFLFFIGAGYFLQAQERCAIEYTEQLRRQRNPKLENAEQFEDWIQQRVVDPRNTLFQMRTQTTLMIPVVVHVIHNGEPIGTGTNISDAQINSQISVLNKDFQRLNADANLTPAEFLPVAGSMDIQFVLAKQDPEGLPTTGINRVFGTQSSWEYSDQYDFKALSYWPAENYLNIWVINLVGGYIGFAQFPVSNLPGLEDASDDRLTDGVVLKYNVVGSVDDGPFNVQSIYNKGRTGTHEVGHFFGLRHIWGDDSGCNEPGDYVSDTPVQNGSTSSCPSHPQISCSTNKMFQNYMDYTNDACMNLITQGQVSRMDVVLANSPRRKSLTTSPGLLDPIVVVNDLGIRSILTPGSQLCPGMSTPNLEVRNYGTG
ncbi:MAG: zinc metalloprotease, partial [Flammeovirgaceae bacterium]|nr:zinc metalloprotease [Flammeovirgaceae bacterium]